MNKVNLYGDAETNYFIMLDTTLNEYVILTVNEIETETQLRFYKQNVKMIVEQLSEWLERIPYE